jgi:hypothetical protein
MIIPPRLPPATRRSILTGAASLGVCGVMCPAYAADTLSNGQFRKEVMALLEKKRPQWHLRLEPAPAEFMIGERRTHLGNLYRTLDGVTGRARETRILAATSHSSRQPQACAWPRDKSLLIMAAADQPKSLTAAARRRLR